MKQRPYHFPTKIIAVDFDGCLCENKYPDIGEPHIPTITSLQMAAATGTNIILWTCRTGERLQQALDWCDQNEVPYHFVNENDPSMIHRFKGDTRKVYADEYWDDKAVNVKYTA
jgi:hypothetical protein